MSIFDIKEKEALTRREQLFEQRKTVLSDDQVYRFCLWREWNTREMDLAIVINSMSQQVAHKGFVNWVMLNPSTADATNDDATLRRITKFSKVWGYAGLCVTNLFAVRATDPSYIETFPTPIGLHNNEWIKRAAKHASLVVCAWGNHGAFNKRSSEVIELFRYENLQLHYLRMTQQDEPEHPLRLPKTLVPKLWT